jgi:predicted peptidase
MKRTIKTYAGIQYIEYMPSRIDGIILYYHGLGEVGKGIDAIEVNEIPKLYKNGVEKNYITICPYLASGTQWPKNTIMAMLDLIDSYSIDNKIVTGLSLGGNATLGTLYYANEKYKRNNFFTSAGVVCGKLNYLSADLDLTPYTGCNLRWWHGTNDAVQPINIARKFNDFYKAATGKTALVEYAGLGHNVWGKAYSEEELSFWKWIAAIELPDTREKIVDMYVDNYNLIVVTEKGKFKTALTKIP